MDIQAVNTNMVNNGNGNEKETKTDKAVERVQREFINQICEGKSEKEAFVASLHAIDEKYNPQEDEFHKEGEMVYGCQGKLGARSISPEKVKFWVGVIAQAVPILESFVDWIISIKNGKQTNEETKNSTTA